MTPNRKIKIIFFNCQGVGLKVYVRCRKIDDFAAKFANRLTNFQTM